MIQQLIYADGDELSRAYAEWLLNFIRQELVTKDRLVIALSGGSTPKKLFRLLAAEPYRSGIDWSKLHFFWGDERFVPYTDDRNNAKMAFDELLGKVPVNTDQVHIMPTDLEPADAVIAYTKILHEYFDGKKHTFDLVMLGLGDNAHTLSLFPGYPIIHEAEEWVSAFFLKEQDMYRISLTKAVVNQSACITYLVAGADKAPAVKAIIEGPVDHDLYPAQVIETEGALIWFLDAAAAADLTPQPF